jgi:general L-amino acid transport system substrate-binding protein
MKHLVRVVTVAGLMVAGLAVAVLPAWAAGGSTLDKVKERGHLECGVHLGLPGFSSPDDKGVWRGLDVDYCRAVAAAIFGDPEKVKYTPTSSQHRFAILQSGQLDLLARNTTWTLSRDASLGIDFVAINFYEGQTFMVRKSSGVKTLADLKGATTCVAAGSTEEKLAGDYFAARGIDYKIVTFEKNDDAVAAYDAERCDTYTAGVGALAGQRAKLKKPDDNIILDEVISNDPSSAVVRHGDNNWGDIVRWCLNAMIEAERLEITSANVDDIRKSSKLPEVRRLLGVEGELGPMLGLPVDWSYNIIKKVGNYGESYERTVGKGSPLKLERGRQQLWTKGGLLYSPPFL